MTRRNEEMYSQQKQFMKTPPTNSRPRCHLPEQAGIAGRNDRIARRATGRNRGHPPESGTYREIGTNPCCSFRSRERSIPRNKEVELNPIIKELVEDFQEIYEHKNLHVEVEKMPFVKSI